MLVPLGSTGSNAILLVAGVTVQPSQDVLWAWAVPRGFDAPPRMCKTVSFPVGIATAGDIDLAPMVAASSLSNSLRPRQVRIHCQRSRFKRHDLRFSCTMILEEANAGTVWRYMVSNTISRNTSAERPMILLRPSRVIPRLQVKAAMEGQPDIVLGVLAQGCSVNLAAPLVRFELLDLSNVVVTNVCGVASDFPLDPEGKPDGRVRLSYKTPYPDAVRAVVDLGPAAGVRTQLVSRVPVEEVPDVQVDPIPWFRIGAWSVLALAVFFALRRDDVAAKALEGLDVLKSVLAWSPFWIPLWTPVCLICIICALQVVAHLDRNSCVILSDTEVLYRGVVILFCIVMAPCIVAWTACRIYGIDKWCIFRSLFVAAAGTSLVLFLGHDEPAAKPPCSWDDMPVPPAECLGSTSLLARFRLDAPAPTALKVCVPDEAHDMFMPKAVIDNTVTVLSEAVSTAWSTNIPLRAAVQELDRYTFLPSPAQPVNEPFVDPAVFGNVARLYRIHAVASACEGRAADGAANLAVMISVCRKMLPFARTTRQKYIAASFMDELLPAATFIALRPETPNAALAALRPVLVPFSTDEASLAVPLMGDLLATADILRANKTVIAGTMQDHRWIAGVLNAFGLGDCLYSMHATLREQYAYAIAGRLGAMQVPAVFPDLSAEIRLECSSFSVKNYAGRQMLAGNGGLPVYLVDTIALAKVRCELLGVHVARRLGTTVTVADYYGHAAYPIDARTGLPFSIGPDGIAQTEDDIVLGR